MSIESLLAEINPGLLEKHYAGETIIPPASIEEFVKRIPKPVMPEVITLREVGDRLVLLRSPKLPEFAFVLWANREPSTRWRIQFEYSVGDKTHKSRRFYVMCACCDSHNYGIIEHSPDLDEAEFKRRDNQLRDEFPPLIEKVCVQYGVGTLFVRRADAWSNKYHRKLHDINLVEAGDYSYHIKRHHGDDIVEEQFSWLSLLDRG